MVIGFVGPRSLSAFTFSQIARWYSMNIAPGQMGIPALTMPLSKDELNAARAKRKAALEATRQDGR